MERDRKNCRGPEVIVGTYWGMAAKQTNEIRDGIQIISQAAFEELVTGIPLDDRQDYIERFQRRVHAALGMK